MTYQSSFAARHLSAHQVLTHPLLNKGTAFSAAERDHFQLHGLLPPAIETLDEQVDRLWPTLAQLSDPLEQHRQLRALQDSNETLFYALVRRHLSATLPLIYTPTVGAACQHFSALWQQPRGLILAWSQRDKLDAILQAQPEVDIIVATDGERVLGLGDLGIGGLGISIGKLALYTACGGIHPARTLPITLDTGTNNPHCLADPHYLGLRQPRLDDDEYYAFVDQVIQAIKRRWPRVLLQFEDFAQRHAAPLLMRYHDQLCCFNDDIQGTAAVAVGCLLAACAQAERLLHQQTIVFAGAGSAGCGIAEQLVSQMRAQGLSEADARARIFMVDKNGLLTDEQPGLTAAQRPFARSTHTLSDAPALPTLDAVIDYARPGILIGVSGQAGLFSEKAIRTMARYAARPIILPLSNPTACSEARPQDLLNWTDGRALIATGSPMPPVSWHGQTYPVAQCNNAFIFPGVGLGVLAAQASRVTSDMLTAASQALAEAAHRQQKVLPDVSQLPELAHTIALATARAAVKEGVAPLRDETALRTEIDRHYWTPRYDSLLSA